MDQSPASAEPSRKRIRKVQTWGYQLQGRHGRRLKATDLAKVDFDLLVIDYADGSRPWTAAEIEIIRRKPDGSRRIVLAYFSIGEAEDYRFYWKKSWKKHKPEFLAKANKDWGGNYKVRFWMPAWQEIIVGSKSSDDAGKSSYLDQIVEAGFDGVYLDIVDAFEYFGPQGDQRERPKAAEDMCRLIARIGRRARKHHKKSGFLIVPQNGANILDDMPERFGESYLKTVDGIGAEDSFYFGNRDHDNLLRPQRDTIKALRKFRKAGLPVLAVDYLVDKKMAANFVKLARKENFIPFVGHRELDRFPAQPKVVD
jgi:cysteinyl-tRNA synthetase